jgi:acetyl esterase/lipase
MRRDRIALAIAVLTCLAVWFLGLADASFAASAPSPSASPLSASPSSSSTDSGGQAQGRTVRDVPYAGHGTEQLLDLYLPAGSGTPTPVVLVIHGGAFSAGGRGDEADTVSALLARGYAVADVGYRLSDQAPFPAAVRDVKAAVRWLRAHAGEYGLDPGRFAAWGTSAGGYLAAMIGASGDEFTGLDDPSLGNSEHSSAVEAVVDLYGPTEFAQTDAQAAQAGCSTDAQQHDAADSPESRFLNVPVQTAPELVAAADPISYVRAARVLPRFLIGHGSADCTVPPGQSKVLSAALEQAGVPADYRVLQGAGHADPRFGSELRTPAIDFLDQALAVPTRSATGDGQ